MVAVGKNLQKIGAYPPANARVLDNQANPVSRAETSMSMVHVFSPSARKARAGSSTIVDLQRKQAELVYSTLAPIFLRTRTGQEPRVTAEDEALLKAQLLAGKVDDGSLKVRIVAAEKGAQMGGTISPRSVLEPHRSFKQAVTSKFADPDFIKKVANDLSQSMLSASHHTHARAHKRQGPEETCTSPQYGGPWPQHMTTKPKLRPGLHTLLGSDAPESSTDSVAFNFSSYNYGTYPIISERLPERLPCESSSAATEAAVLERLEQQRRSTPLDLHALLAHPDPLSVLGERLYQLIECHEAALPGKITGMLLDGLSLAELHSMLVIVPPGDAAAAIASWVGTAQQVLHEAAEGIAHHGAEGIAAFPGETPPNSANTMPNSPSKGTAALEVEEGGTAEDSAVLVAAAAAPATAVADETLTAVVCAPVADEWHVVARSPRGRASKGTAAADPDPAAANAANATLAATAAAAAAVTEDSKGHPAARSPRKRNGRKQQE